MLESVWLEVFGRAHPLVLHLPIGVFAALLTLELLALLRRRPLEHGTRGVLCGLLTLSALVTAGSGWFLGHEDAYGGERLELHETLGIAFALVSVLIAAAAWSDLRKLYGVALAAGLVLVTLTGHHGGSMTHGSDFLLAPLREASEQVETATRADLANPNAAFVGLQELLAARCGACHGADKHKGGLALHTREALLAGGQGGPVVIKGDAASSELIRRMRLPLDHDEHMPPSSKRQPSAEEIEQLEAWITAGLPPAPPADDTREAALTDAPAPANTPDTALAGNGTSQPITDSVAPISPTPLKSSEEQAFEAKQQEIIDLLRAQQVHIESADPATDLLWVDARASAGFADPQLFLAAAVLRTRIARLTLRSTKVSDDSMQALAWIEPLTHLDVSGTAITESGLAELRDCERLEHLDLSSTQIGDSSTGEILDLPALKSVNVWNSKMTEVGVARLHADRPDLHVIDGQDLLADALEVEPAFELVEPPPQMGTGTHLYEWSPNWLQLPDGQAELGNTHGEIVVDRAGNLHLNTDTAQAIMVFAPDGRFVRSWGAEFANGLHGMQLVEEGGDEFLYFVHFGRHEFVKATLDGEIVWRMGYPEASGKYASAEQFKPTSITVAPNGEFFVADGYGQHWVHHYDAQRNWLRAIGGQGSEPGEFQTPHGVWVDTRGAQPELLVADRENSRLQRFDLQGNWLGVIEGMLRRPCKIQQRGEYLVIPDLAGRVTILDGANELVTQLGDNPDPARRANNGVPMADWRDGEFLAPHSAAWDAHGNLYVMDWNQHGRITKLRRQGD